MGTIGGALVVIVAVATLIFSPTPTAYAAPCGRLLFFSHGEGFRGLSVVRGDGTGHRDIRRAGYAEFLLSPDASRVAFHRFDASSDTSDVWVTGTDGGRLRNLTKTPSLSETVYSWAPGSRRVAIERSDGSDIPTIYLLNVHNGNLVRVADGFRPALSPSGDDIAFARPSFDLLDPLDQTWDLYTIDLRSRVTSRLTDDPRSDDTSPRWSPTGDWLAFNRYPTAQRNENHGPYSDLWRVRPSGQGERNLTNDQDEYNGVSSASWSPNGKWIAYNTEWDDGGTVHVMRSDGTRDRPVVRSFAEYSRDPTWSPQGRKIAYERSTSTSTDIWSFDLRRRSNTNLTKTPERSDSQPMWASCRA